MGTRGTVYVGDMTGNIYECGASQLDERMRQLRAFLQWEYGHPPESGYALLFRNKWLKDSNILNMTTCLVVGVQSFEQTNHLRSNKLAMIIICMIFHVIVENVH